MSRADRHIWSIEETEYLREIAVGNSYKEIQKMMTEKFNYEYRYDQIRRKMHVENIVTGRQTKFQKGNESYNRKPIGSEMVRKNDYIFIKIAEPNVWVLKHRWIYEKANGEIPSGYRIIFADGNKTNFDLDNLILVSRSELLTMNRHSLITDNKECTKSGLLVAKILNKTYELKKRGLK